MIYKKLILSLLVVSLLVNVAKSQTYIENKHLYQFSKYTKYDQFFAINGEHALALKYADLDNKEVLSIEPKDSIEFHKYSPKPAKEYIAEQAAKNQIVIINEAHHITLHRAFILSLLKDLYKAGYRYYCGETLYRSDSLQNKRKYPVIKSGFYTQDPVYGEIVREALSLGFKLIPYEAYDYQSPEVYENGKLSLTKGHSLERYIKQALTISNIIYNDPKAKIFVHVGYGHVHESGQRMAYYLKQFTDINPFTVDQVQMTERSSEKLLNSIYKMAHFNEPSIFFDSLKNPYVSPNERDKVDVTVFHPVTKYEYGRPTWLNENNSKVVLLLTEERIGISYPWKVFAYDAGEYSIEKDGAIPLDIIEVDNKNDNKALLLPRERKIFIQVFNGRNQNYSFKYEPE